MTIAVDFGHKATKTNKKTNKSSTIASKDNLTGMILIWPSLIIVQMVLVLCIFRSHRLKIDFQNETFNIWRWGHGLSLIRQTGEAGNQTCDPWFIRRAVYALGYTMVAPQICMI